MIDENPETRQAMVIFWLSMLPSIIASIIALAAPANIMDKLPWLAGAQAFLIETIPSVAGTISYSKVPQVTSIVLVFSWGFFPLQFLFVVSFFMRYFDAYSLILGARKQKLSKWKLIGILLLLISLVFWGIVVHPAKFARGFLAVDDGRVGLAVIVPFAFWVFSAFVALLAFVISKMWWRDF